MNGLEQIRDAYDALVARIAAVERDWTHDVEIVAVTKAFPPAAVEYAVEVGFGAIGENYAQELLAKQETIDAQSPRPRVDFIGRLQSNKVRLLSGVVDRWASVDRTSLAKEIARRDPAAHVLVQVNSTGEDSKGGCAPEFTVQLVEQCRDLGLVVDGLLTVGPTGTTPDAAAPGFRMVRGLVDELGLDVCSMGMSADLDVAIAAGATSVRIGSDIFGARPVHPSTEMLG